MRHTLLVATLLLVAPLAALGPGSTIAAEQTPQERAEALGLDANDWIVGFQDIDRAALDGGTWRGHEITSTNQALGTVVVDVQDPVAFQQDAEQDDNVAYTQWDDPLAFVVDATPDDPRYPEQYGFPQIEAPGAWDTTFGSPDVKVAIIDTGIDQDHEDLQNVVADQYDFVNDDPTANDACGHGTHVAGTVAANTDNGIGVAGTAPDSQLLIAKALTNTLLVQCTGSTSDIADAITWSTDNGADVISMSLGSSSGSQTLKDAVRYAWDNGVLLVGAAGNDGSCTDCVGYPAAYPEVVAVTCTDSAEAQCSFSSQGPEAEIAAPGNDILSTYNNGGYTELSGTSMSTPHVSGVAALLLAANSTLTNSQLRDTLNTTAQDLGDTGPDNIYGHGEVDAQAAVAAVSGGGSGGGGGNTTNSAPTADIQTSCTDLTCDLDGSGSTDSDGTVDSYAWDFGDGGTGSGATTSHTYESEGTYTVTLTVTDDDGATDSTSQDITVSPSDTGSAGLSEDFEDGDPGWTAVDDSGASSWALSTSRSVSPSHSMALADYSPDETDHLITEPIDLAGLSNPTLQLESRMEGECSGLFACVIYDYGRIQVSADGGSTWTTLETNYWDSGGQFETLTYDLSDWSDQTVQVRFSFFSDGSVQNEGWYIDDVAVS